MKILVHIVRFLVGGLFIFSGLVKTIDPIGFGYKLEDYFAPNVFDMPFLAEYALPLSVFFVIFEVMLGVFLLLGAFKKFTLYSLLGLIVFFTFLTFYSAYFNKVTDCGCFGDALKLTPWESFTKDVILLIMIVFLWIFQQHIKPILSNQVRKIAITVSFVACCWIAYQGINHLPLIDFRAYAVGNNIQEGMEGFIPDTELVTYHLKNTETNETVTLVEDDYLAQPKYWDKGSVWTIEETTSEVIEEGYEPPIHDFVIDCSDKGDLTYHYLELPKLMIIVTPNVQKANDEGLNKIESLVTDLQGSDIEFLNLASDNLIINNLEPCLMDMTTLKTIIRSSPGIVVLEKGTILAKYHWKDTPKAEEINQLFSR